MNHYKELLNNLGDFLKDAFLWLICSPVILFLYIIRYSQKMDDSMPPSLPPEPTPPPSITKRELLLGAAIRVLGKDASPKNLAPKEVSCAEGVSNIIHSVFPTFPQDVLSTAELDGFLARSPLFKPTKIPKPGNIIISPRTANMYGHVGIFKTHDSIMSNDSRTGLFQENYTIDSWVREYRDKRGLPIFFYECAE